MSFLRLFLLVSAGSLLLAGARGEEVAPPPADPSVAAPAPEATPADTAALSLPDPALPATEPADAAVPDPATAEGTVSARRMAARSRFLRLLDENRNAEAVVAGTELVALTREEFGADSIRLATPLTNLGTAQLRAGNATAAEASYAEAVELIEDSEGILSPRLENPLLGLGETYMRAERYPQATTAYERALRVSQVNEGLYNLEQIPIRDGLAEGYLQLGDLEKANFHQESQVTIQVRRVGGDSASVTPTMYKLGRWYERSGQPERARFAYQRAARMVEAEKGDNAPELVEPLIAMGDSYVAQALLPPDPQRPESPISLLPMSSAMYRKALTILDKQPEPDPALRARAYVALGDLYMLWNRRTTALQAYGNAWTTLATDASLDELRAGYFDQPSRLMGTDPPRLYPRSVAKDTRIDRSKLLPGFVLVGYAVEPTGRAVDVQVIESDPPGLLDATVADAVRGSLFRPRVGDDGAPIRADGLVYRHEFRYAEGRLKPKAAPIPDGGRIDEPGRLDLPPASSDQPPPPPAGDDVPLPPPGGDGPALPPAGEDVPLPPPGGDGPLLPPAGEDVPLAPPGGDAPLGLPPGS
jgi:tetratricopeptide (TPR) repeat protein